MYHAISIDKDTIKNKMVIPNVTILKSTKSTKYIVAIKNTIAKSIII